MRVGAMADKNNAMKLTAACKLAPISPRVMVAIAKNLLLIEAQLVPSSVRRPLSRKSTPASRL